MLTRVRMWLIACAAIAALLAIAGNGSARRLSFERQDFRIVWNPLNFRQVFGPEIRCRVTLGGSFTERTIAKVANSTIGRITEASIAGCTGGEGEMDFLTEKLPWALKYTGFLGTLPDILQLTTVFGAMPFVWNITFIQACLFPATSGTELPVNWVFGWEVLGRERDLIQANASEAITLTSSNCEGWRMRVGGAGRVTYRGSEVPPHVVLI